MVKEVEAISRQRATTPMRRMTRSDGFALIEVLVVMVW